MADEVYRPRKVNPKEVFAQNAQIRAAAQGSKEEIEARGEGFVNAPPTEESGGFQMKGTPHPDFQEMLQQNVPQVPPEPIRSPARRESSADQRRDTLKKNGALDGMMQASDDLKNLLNRIKETVFNYDEIYLPSRGLFYNGEDGPQTGVLHIRPMSGKEEEILATPRWAKSGKALNMIIQSCLKEKYDVNGLLTSDRTYLIIFLRGISYGPDYEVEIKCPNCNSRFSHVINLNSDIHLDECPEDFTPDKMVDSLPTTELKFGYHLSNGYDDDAIQRYRERTAKFFGDRKNDDTLTERIAQLTDYIDNITNKNEIKALIEQLPVSDVNYLRNVINDPPFGVDTKVQVICPMCYEEFGLELPMETNFFFPRRVRTNV